MGRLAFQGKKMKNLIFVFLVVVHSLTICECTSKAQEPVEAFIYYEVNDRAFERVALTLANGASGNSLLLPVKTKADFIKAWQKVNEEAKSGKLVALHLITHASKDTKSDGLEFFAIDGEDATLTKQDITSLVRLPFAESDNTQIFLYGCNTGVVGERGWCPAEQFAKTQKVKASGESGFSYFSKDRASYKEQVESDETLYLHAYKRAKNGLLGNGARIPATVFEPN
jgi:hypothetical protein